MTMKNIVFWDVAPCDCNHLLTCDLVLLACSEDVGDTFLRNIGSNQSYTMLHPRRLYSSNFGLFTLSCVKAFFDL
jgi:hypothetical protein